MPPHFVLYGGTALSLRLAHRRSVDFDFFSTRSFAPGDLLRSTPLLGGGTPLRSSPDTLTVEVDGVVLSFFGALNLGSVGVPEVAADNDVPVASVVPGRDREAAGEGLTVVIARPAAPAGS